jgi:hypothetical protein
MSINNLRVIYNNLIDLSATTITPSSTASGTVTTANLKLDPKSQVWRTASYSGPTGVKANLIVNLVSNYVVGGIILAFTNLSPEAYIRVRGYTGALPTTDTGVSGPAVTPGGLTVFDTGNVVAVGQQNLGGWQWGSEYLGPTAYTTRRNYAKVWIPPTSQVGCTSLSIEITDPYCIDQFIEASRLIIGPYWSPKYNTSFGLSATPIDMSTSERTESGDLITTAGIIYNKMTFDLKYMDKGDRTSFNTMIKTVGTRRPIFISLFPDNSEDVGKEQTYQMYGKLSSLYGIEHPIFEMYSSQVEMEEI